MAVRALPYSNIQNPALGLVSPDYLGYASGNTDFALVSHYGKRLFIGQENTYCVFINDNLDTSVYHFEWSIRRFDYLAATWDNANLLGADNTTETGELNWTPAQGHGTGRYEISVQISSDSNPNLATCSLVQNVFAPFTGEELQNEANAAASLQGCNVANIATLGNPAIMQSIICKYWDYIVQECYRVPNPNDLIKPYKLVNIIYKFQEYYLANQGQIDIAPLVLADTGKLSSTYRHAYQEINLCCSAMLAGITTWRGKSDDATTWEAIETSMQSDFDNLTLEQQTHLYNLLRFPKSLVRFIADAMITIANFLGQGADEQQLNRAFSKYFAFATPEKDLDSLHYFDNVFINSALRVPHFQDRTDPAYNFNIIAQNNLAFNAQGQEVTDLKNDLAEIGFTLVSENINNDNPVNNQFNLITEWAVREFQIYAKMHFVARVREDYHPTTNPLPYHQRLRRTPNLLPYTGPVSGVANEETRKLIKIWKIMKWRCPVVVTAFTRPANSPNPRTNAQFTVLHTSNLWRHNRVDDIPRVFVQDFSGYWTIPDNRLLQITPLLYNGKMALGTFTLPSGYPGGQLNSSDAFLWVGTTNNNLLNITGGNLDSPTFHVINSVQRRESGGFMEVVNCWDDAYLSWGYFHWTIGRLNNNIYDRGELQGFLSYLKSDQPDDLPRVTANQISESYKRVMLFFGLNTNREWNDTISLNNCFLPDQRKYADDFSTQQENFSWHISNTVRNAAIGNHNYYRTWHSFYRWIMALRTEPAIRTAMWRYARLRLRDLRNTSWGIDNANDWKNIKDQNGANINPALSEVFRSEKALALLLRWHVNTPGNVVSTNISNTIKTIYHFARCGNLVNVQTTNGLAIDIDDWISSDLNYYRTPILDQNNQIIGWNQRIQGFPPINAHARTISGTVRSNLFLAPEIQGDPFVAPNNWGNNDTIYGVPGDTVEADFCRAIILYIRLSNNGSLKTSMGLVYHEVPSVAQTFVMDETGL